jgi:hypothetical protein
LPEFKSIRWKTRRVYLRLPVLPPDTVYIAAGSVTCPCTVPILQQNDTHGFITCFQTSKATQPSSRGTRRKASHDVKDVSHPVAIFKPARSVHCGRITGIPKYPSICNASPGISEPVRHHSKSRQECHSPAFQYSIASGQAQL